MAPSLIDYVKSSQIIDSSGNKSILIINYLVIIKFMLQVIKEFPRKTYLMPGNV